VYCYLLGLYLGDGCISRIRRVWKLRITLDAKYIGIIDRCREAVDILMPGQRAAVLLRSDHCVEVSLSSKHSPCLFPQHGPGKKHLRADPACAPAGTARQTGPGAIHSWSDRQ
jgi:hypothetical protein